MTAYVVSDVEILDPEAFEAYADSVPAVLERHGVEYVVRGGAPTLLEGSWNTRRLIILRFCDREHVREWYESSDYQQMMALRADAARVSAVVVDGVDVPPTTQRTGRAMTVPDEQISAYERASFGGRLRRGDTPAVLVVDLTLGFTDPAGSFGSDLTAEVEATRRVLDAARAQGHLIIFSTVGFDPSLRDTGVALQKAPRGIEMVVGGDSSILDPRLGRRDDEVVILKRAPSALFGTSVSAILMGNQINTVVLCGAVTSGCIRATCVDLYSYGLPTLIPRDCVGDRAQGPHEANLYDMQAKYADVVTSDEVISYLTSVRGRESPSTQAAT